MKRLFFIFALFFFSCADENPVPKPIGYFRIDLPESDYREKEPLNCPLEFQISQNSRLEYTSKDKCWFNVSYPAYRAKIHLTYKPVEDNLRDYIEESRTLTYEHQIKANSIRQNTIVDREREVYGLIYDLGGSVASPVQFYLTDSTNHFLRGSLYFNARPNPDSIKPVLRYVRSDIDQMIESLNWTD